MSTAAQIQTQADSVVQHQPQQETNQLMSDIFKELRAPTVQLDPFDGNPMDFPFFMANFAQAIEEKIEDGKGRLARLIQFTDCLLYTSPSPRDGLLSRMPSSA